jgi:cephalosporin-C deacetylase
MPIFDMPLQKLESYRPAREEQPDFDEFWQESLEETQTYPIDVQFKPVDWGLQTVRVFDVTFAGFAGQPIKGWLLMPRRPREPLPCVVEFIGYEGGRGLPYDWLIWSAAGFANLVMDTRGQGSDDRSGDTPDVPELGYEPHVPGFMTLGISNPQTYYYRRVFLDAVRAVEAARLHPAVEETRIAVSGNSQGGGISLAVGSLSPDVKVVMADVPFLCHYRRATEITNVGPYNEITRYCKSHRDKIETVFQTLSYFDGVNFAVRSKASALFSLGLMDETCPPSTVFAAYNYYAGPKELRVWEYNEHEGGGMHQVAEKIRFLQEMWS